jgi:predicted transcriptional regulator
MMAQSKMEPKDYGFMNWWELLESQTMRHDILTRPDLSRAARDLFAFLMRAKKTLKFIIFGIKYISAELHYHPRTVQRAVKQLVDAGLLIVEYRTSPKLDPTSNRYFPRWSPYEAPQSDQSSTLTHADLKETRPNSLPLNSAQFDQKISSSKPGGDPAVCRDPQPVPQPQTLETQGIETSPQKPIQDLLLRKKDQPGVAPRQAAQILKNAPAHPKFDDVIASIPKDWNIYTPRLAQWIEKFGVDRIKTVIRWVQDAPKGTIRQPGGWMYRALTEAWSEPTWEGDTVKRTQSALIRKQQIDEEMNKREREEKERQVARAAFEQTWTTIDPLIDQPIGEVLLKRAYELASEALKWATTSLFKTDTPIWRSFIIQASKEILS